MVRSPPADNNTPHFLDMMVRAPRAVDLLPTVPDRGIPPQESGIMPP